MDSVFVSSNHLFLNNPRGGVEDVAAMAAAGFKAIFCNVADFPPGDWQTIRARAAAANVVCGPWARVAEGSDDAPVFSRTKLNGLISVADQWNTPLIVNAEKELDGSGASLTTYLRDRLGQRDWALSMETWPFASVEWWPLAKVPVLPQLFLASVQAESDQVVSQWHAYGIRCVVLTFGSYGGSVPGEYERLSPYGVFTADACSGNYQSWAAIGKGEPCLSGGDDVTPIGTEDGIKASCNRLRDLDPAGTLLVKNVDTGKWPDLSTLTAPVNQWKAYDKLQRTLQILKDDHDGV